VHLTSKQFADAAKIAEQIEALEKQINDLLQGKEITFQPESSPKAPPTRRGLAAQECCDFSAGRQQRRKRDIEACSGSNSQKEQTASQDGRYLQRACGPRVSVYFQRAEENPRNSTLQDVRSPAAGRWPVQGQVKGETIDFEGAS